MSNEMMILPDGTEVGTGATVPPVRTTNMRYFTEAVGLLSKDEVVRILSNPTRLKSRSRYPVETYNRNQGSYGSCNGWAGAKGVEKTRVDRGLPYVGLSGESLYAQINFDRDQGSILEDGMEAIQKTGVAPLDLVPRGQIYMRQLSQQAKDSMVNYRALECYAVSDSNTAEMELATGLALGFQAIVAVHADNAFMRLDGDGIAYGGRGAGNHSVNVDDVLIHPSGYFMFDMDNSWGLTYGDKGRALLTWDRHLRHTNPYHVFYLIRSTVDGQGNNPFQ